MILLDLTTIPGPSSREVVAEAVQTRPDVRVVLTSAYSEEMIKDTISASQIHGFIRKPFRLVDLTQKLREVLGKAPETGRRHGTSDTTGQVHDVLFDTRM